MSYEMMKGMVKRTLSREEMKEIVAGSGCGVCYFMGEIQGNCFKNNGNVCECAYGNPWPCSGS